MSEELAPGNVDGGPDWGRRFIWAVGLLAVLVIVLLVASATVPRWWAHRIGDQVDGSITQGTLLGLFYGFVFTLVPIALVILILRWRRTWKTAGSSPTASRCGSRSSSSSGSGRR